MLAELRGSRSRPEVAAWMARNGCPLDQSALKRYEDGDRIPNVAVLATLARLYKNTTFERLCSSLAAELLGQPAPEWKGRRLTEPESELLGYFRAVAKHPRSQKAMLIACEALTVVPAHEADVVG